MFSSFFGSRTPTTSTPAVDITQLSSMVVPHRYRVHLRPNFVEERFDGQVMVEVHVQESVSTIVMHAVGLKFHEIWYKTEGGQVYKPEKYEMDVEHEHLVLYFAQPLPLGAGWFDFKYEGELNEYSKGFYLSRFHVDGTDHVWGVGQFKLFGARHVLPAWDEPRYKASVVMSLEVPSNYGAISNTFEHDESQAQKAGWKVVNFVETPIISLHHLTFVIGQFDYIERPNVDGVRFRIYLPTGSRHWDDWKLDAGVKLFSFFKRYFKSIDYPWTKLDTVVIPNHHFMAIGNLGIVSVDDQFYFVDQPSAETKAQFYKHRIEFALHFANLISRQWFENVISFKKWKYHWVNEGFAHFIKYMAVDRVWPEWRVWSHFHVNETLPALEADAHQTGHSLEDEQYWVREYGQVAVTDHTNGSAHHTFGHWKDERSVYNFYHHYYHDPIIRHKSAVIFYQLYHYIGDAYFYKSVSTFLARYFKAHDNVVEVDDFWHIFEQESHKPVRKLIEIWAVKKAFPVVQVSGRADSRTGNYVLTLKQQSVLENAHPTYGKFGHVFGNQEAYGQWWIPIVVATDPTVGEDVIYRYPTLTQSEKDHYGFIELLMDKEIVEVVIPSQVYNKAGGYYQINWAHFGHFVVDYSDRQHIEKKLLGGWDSGNNNKQMVQKSNPNIHIYFDVLVDVWHFTRLGHHPVSFYFDLIEAHHERWQVGSSESYLVWSFIFWTLHQWRQMVVTYDNYDIQGQRQGQLAEHFNKYVWWLLKSNFWNDMLEKDPFWSLVTNGNTQRVEQWDGAKWPVHKHLLRYEVIHFLARFQAEHLWQKEVVLKTFWAWYEGQVDQRQRPQHGSEYYVEPELVKALFIGAAKFGDDRVLEAFFKIYQRHSFDPVKGWILEAFGYFKQTIHLEKIVAFAFSAPVTKHETVQVLRHLAYWYPANRDYVWRVFQDRYAEFVGKFDWDYVIGHLVEVLVASFAYEPMVHEQVKYIEAQSNKDFYKRLEWIAHEWVEVVQILAHWWQRDATTFIKVFGKH